MSEVIRSDQMQDGRYRQGGTSTLQGKMLTWWERKLFQKSDSDVKFTVTPTYQYKPYKLAYDIYGSANLSWFVMQYNNISDVYEDFDVGSEILLPTKSRLYSEILSKST